VKETTKRKFIYSSYVSGGKAYGSSH
jgi:hypothetical protein